MAGHELEVVDCERAARPVVRPVVTRWFNTWGGPIASKAITSIGPITSLYTATWVVDDRVVDATVVFDMVGEPFRGGSILHAPRGRQGATGHLEAKQARDGWFNKAAEALRSHRHLTRRRRWGPSSR